MQPNEVARWDVQGDGHRVGNLAQGLRHPSPSPVDLSCRRTLHLPLPTLQQRGTSQSDGGFTLWTKLSRNQTTLSLPTTKSHQPSTGTPPAQMDGLGGEGTSPAHLGGLSRLGTVAVDLRTNTVIAKVLPSDKQPPVCDTKAEGVPTAQVPT